MEPSSGRCTVVKQMLYSCSRKCDRGKMLNGYAQCNRRSSASNPHAVHMQIGSDQISSLRFKRTWMMEGYRLLKSSMMMMRS